MKKKEEEKESSGKTELAERVVSEALEHDEKTQRRRLSLLNLVAQDMEIIDACEDKGINPRDTFRGFVYDEDDKKKLRIATCGEKGTEEAKRMIEGLREKDEWYVKNETVGRLEWEDLQARKKDKEEKGREEEFTVRNVYKCLLEGKKKLKEGGKE